MAKDPVEILNRRNSEVAKIRGFADLTEEAKARRIAEVNERAQQEYQQAVEDHMREVAERLESTRKAVFRVPIPAMATDAEEAQIHAAYRAAYNDVYHSTSLFSADSPEEAQQELERLLEQAERSGDKLLAKAAYHRVRITNSSSCDPHKPSSLSFTSSEDAKQYVAYLDFDEVVTVKVT